MEIKETKFTFNSKEDILKLSAIRVEPQNPEDVKGIVQLVHGMCEYKERYMDFMRYLAGKGYICVIHDHRGHGESVKSKEDLGYMYEGGYKALIEDIHLLTKMTKEYALQELSKVDLPYILLGHSMGSLAVRCYIKKYDNEIDKLVVVGCPSPQAGVLPGLAFINVLKAVKGAHAHSKLADFLVMDSRYEKKFKAEKLKHSWVNSDKEAVYRYNDDPYCNFTFTLDGYDNLVRLNMETYSAKGYEVNNKNLPIRFFSGKEDPCGISVEAIEKAISVIKNAGYVNVSKQLYDNMRHEILNEPEHEMVYSDILEFIEQ